VNYTRWFAALDTPPKGFVIVIMLFEIEQTDRLDKPETDVSPHEPAATVATVNSLGIVSLR
jgi:hypothetical protein